MYEATATLSPSELAGRLAGIGGPFIVSGIYGAAGYAWVFAYIAACWAVVAGTVALFGPRSGGAVLEELQETEAAAPPTGRFTRAPARAAVDLRR
jgi:putative MFS transporter